MNIQQAYAVLVAKKRGSLVPTTGLLLFVDPSEVDSNIGLSVSDYANVDPTVQTIFFIDSLTLRPTADAYALAIASSYFNGKTMVGNADKGILLLYTVGTSFAITDEAKKYCGIDWYGVAWDKDNSNPDVIRTGLMAAHSSLPVQSKIYACLLADNGTENYKLDPTDWSKKLDGSASNRDGTDGQVMVKFPEYWFRYEVQGNTRRWLMSPVALDGFTRDYPQYISAYEASLQRSTSKLSSVANLTADYRGGNNDATGDALSRTLLGKPATNISRTNFRTYARNRGANWEMDNYFAQRTLLRFFVTEFATRDSQKAVNTALDINGFRQGGLGIGVTNLASATWGSFNSYYPAIPCGFSDSLGSITADTVYAMPPEYGTLDTYVTRYRGVELPFGHLWKNLDGVNLRIFADGESTPVSEAFIADDPANWNDSDYNGFRKIGEVPRTNGYVNELLGGELLPFNVVGAGSTTFWCDYFYTSLPASGESLRTMRLGGSATDGSTAGLGYSDLSRSPSSTNANFGSRLCYIPSGAG